MEDAINSLNKLTNLILIAVIIYGSLIVLLITVGLIWLYRLVRHYRLYKTKQ